MTSRHVMPRLNPGIQAFLDEHKNVDGRDEPGHDEQEASLPNPFRRAFFGKRLRPLDIVYATIAFTAG
jgi:hypothetical protein